MAQAASYIDSSQRVEGRVTASEDLVLAGHLVGDLESSHTLTVDTSGIAEGNLTARRIEIHGVVVGHVTASDDVLVSRTGQVQGSIKARRVQVETGGRLDAEVTSGEGAQPTRSTRRAPSRRATTRPAAPRRAVTRELRPQPEQAKPREAAPEPKPKPARASAKKATAKSNKGRTKRKTATKSRRGATASIDEIVEIPEQETVEDTA